MSIHGTHRLVAAFALVVALGALGGVAASQGDGGDQYTGCLTRGGIIVKAAEGSEPLRPCRGGQTEITWNQTGPPGPPGPSSLSSVYATGTPDTRFEPGDPPVDFMRLELPAGNYTFYVTLSAIPEPLFDPAGNPAGFAMGGSVECRFFEEAADGTRVDLTGIAHGTFGTGAAGSWSLDKSRPGAFVPFLQSGGSTYIHPHGGHPEGAAVVAMCEHSFGELVDLHGSWVAIPIGDIHIQ